MNNAAIAAPTSRFKLRGIANRIRQEIGCSKQLYFPVVEFMEWFMPQLYPGFDYILLERSEMGNCHGKACPEEKVIYLREDVYDGACRGIGRDRFTLAHEISHYILHKPGMVSYARLEQGKKLETFRDPEWQANTLAGELLIPIELIQGMSPDEIASRCGVSYSAANIQLKYV